MRLFKRDGVWYAQIYGLDGERIQRSTRCHDKKAAEAIARQWERDASDPAATAARQTTIYSALELLLKDRAEQAKAKKKSEDTVAFYQNKAGQLVLFFESDGDASRERK